MNKIDYIGKCLIIKDEGERLLVIGDLHLGYEELLNESGIFVSREMFKEMIEYLEKVFSKSGKVDKIILLGDVKHGFSGIMRQERSDILNLVDYLTGKLKGDGKIIAIKGNHDKILEFILKDRKEVELRDYYIKSEFCFMHGDRDFLENYDKKIRYWILGHGHPAVKISDGVKMEKYKCFLEGVWKGKKVIVIPSFFSANEGSDPRENNLGLVWKFNLNRFNVKVVSGRELEVLDFGILSRL